MTAWAVANTAWAAPGIDAGSLLQQMERDRRVPVQKPETSGIAPLQTPESGSKEDEVLHFTVQKINLLNVTAFEESTLLALLADIPGHPVSLAELRDRIKRITGFYQAHGYPAAYAYLPEQTIAEDGVIEIRVLEGYLGEIRLHNQSRLSDAAARDRLPAMRPGDLLKQAPIERGALLGNDIPGVTSATVLAPGRDPGFTDIDITLTDKPRLTAQLSADNQGSRYTGDGNRISVAPEISNPTGYGDKLSAQLLHGGFGMKYGQFNYQLPSYWTGDGRAGVEYGEIRYQLGREFATSRSQGLTCTTAVYGSYPLVRSDALNFVVEGRYQEKLVRDEVLAAGDNRERKSYSQMIALNGDWNDSGLNLWSLSYTAGRLDFSDKFHWLMDQLGAQTWGHYSKYNYNYTRMQAAPLLDDTTLLLSLSGQVDPGRNLDASEKMVLGGMRGVRAYPSSEGMADEAMLATLELRRSLSQQFLLSMFVDYGEGVLNKKTVAAANTTHLGGVGVGMRYAVKNDLWASVQSAWRTTQAKPTAGNDTPNGRVWIELGWVL